MLEFICMDSNMISWYLDSYARSYEFIIKHIIEFIIELIAMNSYLFSLSDFFMKSQPSSQVYKIIAELVNLK